MGVCAWRSFGVLGTRPAVCGSDDRATTAAAHAHHARVQPHHARIRGVSHGHPHPEEGTPLFCLEDRWCVCVIGGDG